MRRYLSIGIVALLATGALVLGFAADAGEQRQPAGADRIAAERVSEVDAAMRRLVEVNDRIAGFQSVQRINCKTIDCLNRQLTLLTKFANQTANHLDRLDAAWTAWYDEWDNCVPVVPVTQYPGYWYTNDGANFFATTGLDYTEEGTTVSDYVLVWTCDVVT